MTSRNAPGGRERTPPRGPRRERPGLGSPGPRAWAWGALTLLLLGFVAWERCGISGCPDVERLAAYRPGGAPVLLDRDDREFADLAPVERHVVPLDELPDFLPAAFVAVEDRRFREHRGVDWRRVLGAAVADIKAGELAQGSSTITMQLARNVFPQRLGAAEKTFRRKLMEVRVARDLEARYTKDEILELYLNHIYFGDAVYGIDAAARHYFGRPAAELDLAQAASLAAMPKAPNLYHPRNHPAAARERRDLVLSLLEQEGSISAEEAEEARVRALRPIREPPPPTPPEPVAPYFARAVRRVLEAELGDALYTTPWRVHTSLDRAAQRSAENRLRRQLARIESGALGPYAGPRYGERDAVGEDGTEYLQGALVLLDARTGDVLAMVGGRDFADSPYDRATQARRQVGSAFKPFVFAAAVEEGFAPSQRLADAPLRIELTGGEVYEPRNFGGRHRGRPTLREVALESLNVPTVRLALAVGLDDVTDAARRAGLQGRLPEVPSLALGPSAHSLLELTAAYAALANGGEAVEPRFVLRVESPDGEVVWQPEPERRRAFAPEVAFLVTDLLRDAVDEGTARPARSSGFRGAAAGKTGTTQDGSDAWFIGYTPERVAGVWVGFDRPRTIGTRATGGRLAAPVWGALMRDLAPSGSDADWERPPGVVELEVDPESGMVLEEGCEPARGPPRRELFLEGEEPASVCPAGGEDGGPGLLARIGDWASTAGRRVGGWVAGLFDDEEEDGDDDRYLGTPRLPRAAEEPPEPPELLGVPLDSLHLLEPDTLEADTPTVDTLRWRPPPAEPPRRRGPRGAARPPD